MSTRFHTVTSAAHYTPFAAPVDLFPSRVIMSEKDITKSAASGIAKLDRLNYVQWCIDVQLLLEEKGIWHFVQGKQVEPEPTAPTAEKAKFMKEKNKSWAIILQSLVPRFQPAVMKKDTAQAVWDHLKKLFEPSSIVRETSLFETFYCMRRNEGEELDSFISRLEKAEDDMVAANAALKPVDHVKAYLLISRVGKEFENQIQLIYQWQKTDFTYEKVLTALLNEHNRRKLVEFQELKPMRLTCSLHGILDDGLYRALRIVKRIASGIIMYLWTCGTNVLGTCTQKTYVGDTPLEISDGRDTHFIPHDDSGDSDDDDTPPPPPQAHLPTHPLSPPLSKPPLPITPKPLLKVTTRRKVMPSSSAQSGTAPPRIALRAPMLSKPGWEREEVKRQTGITKGKWDVYFYAPGRRAPLRSRPELKEYCEQELRVKFNADDFDWVPLQEKPGYLTSDDDEATE
uniref:MBD domain-containing protein n=1 Tax=Strigamia maritima TaxID=126957 RepID=T1IS30_STRMM